jgi:hypothetical protein
MLVGSGHCCSRPPAWPTPCTGSVLCRPTRSGQANIALVAGRIQLTAGYAGRCPDSASFRRVLDAELARLERFLVVHASACLESGDATAFGQ